MQPETPTPANVRWTRLIGFGFAWMCFALCFLLWIIYTFIGDTTPFGEAYTTVPPIVWLAPLAVIAIPVLLARSARALGIVAAGVFVLGSADDWESLFKHTGSWDERLGVRAITWNIAGQTDWNSVLTSLEPWQPDIVFLQETPDGDASLSTATLRGYWHGFSWLDQGDCGILSRFPLKPLETEKIGPWDKPALALAEVSHGDKLSTTPVLLSSVRLMMPSNSIYPGVIPTARDHQLRLRQYSNLASLITKTERKTRAKTVVIGGDFNVRGGSASLMPLVDAGLSDSWIGSESGWGATILSDFPVARIDHLWLSGCVPAKSRTAVGKNSDHRMVIADLIID